MLIEDGGEQNFEDDTSGGDSNFANVVLLCHFDGADGSTTINDVKSHSLTVSGNAQLDTADKKFGTAALLLDGSGDWVRATNSADFDMGSGNFSIEGWFKTSTSGADQVIASNYNYSSSARSWAVLLSNGLSGKMAFITSGNGAATVQAESNAALNDGAWHFFAAIRNGNEIALWIDGIKQTTTATQSGSIFSAQRLSIGEYSGESAGAFNGWIDDLRITKGVARSGAQPSTAFPDSA